MFAYSLTNAYTIHIRAVYVVTAIVSSEHPALIIAQSLWLQHNTVKGKCLWVKIWWFHQQNLIGLNRINSLIHEIFFPRKLSSIQYFHENIPWPAQKGKKTKERERGMTAC